MPLTVKKLEKLSEHGRYADGNGLYLQINANGAKSWLFRFERKGRERWMGLGPTHTHSLEEARAKARAARQRLYEGADPLADRRAQATAQALEAAKTKTFADCAQAFFDAHEAKWSNPKHRAQFLSTLKAYAYPTIGKLPVAEIDITLIVKLLEPIWWTKTETASRVRNRIEQVLNWATVIGYRVGDNPARWRGYLDKLLPSPDTIAKVKHHAAMPFVEIPQFMTALRARNGIGARALEFTVLTAARTNEVTKACWSEFDLSARAWTVPGERMKAKRPHRVPLSDRAITILEALPRESDWVFVGTKQGKPISNAAMDEVLDRMGLKDRATVHGMRSSFKDWAVECTAHPPIVSETALAHTIESKVEAAYRRGDLFTKRQRLMADWARYCMSKPVDASIGNITPLRKV